MICVAIEYKLSMKAKLFPSKVNIESYFYDEDERIGKLVLNLMEISFQNFTLLIIFFFVCLFVYL